MTNHREHPDKLLLTSAAFIAIAGTILMFLGNVIGSMIVPDHDWVSDTISDLAAGRYEIIQDVALYCYAGSLMACALAAAHLHLDGARWTIGIGCLSLLTACVVVIGARNEYGDQDNDGIVIHIYVVYVLGLLFAALFLSMGRGLASISRHYARVSYGCAALWILGAPAFFLMPTGYDGAFERGLGLITMVWIVSFAWMLMSVAREKPSSRAPR